MCDLVLLLYFDKVRDALFDQYIFNQFGYLGFIGSHFENIHVHRVLRITQIVSIHFIYGLPNRKMLRSVWKTTTKDILSRPSWFYRQQF